MSVRNKRIASLSLRRGASQLPRAARLRKVAVWLVIACVVIIATQFLYPANITLPNARVGAAAVSMKGKEEVAATMATSFADWQRTVAAGEHEYKTSAADLGFAPDAQRTFDGPLAYPWWQRLIPGSFVWRLFGGSVAPEMRIDDAKLQAFAAQIHEQNGKPETNATLTMNGEEPTVVPEVEGFGFPVEDVAKTLRQEFFGSKDKLTLHAKTLTPAVRTGDANAAAGRVKQYLAKPPTYKLDGNSTAVSAGTLASWMEFTPDTKAHTLVVGLSSAKLQEFLASLRPYAYTVPGNTVATVDGKNVTVLPGNAQQAIDVAAAIANLRDTAQHIGESRTAEIPQITLTTALKAKRSYSKSQLGLQTLVQDIVTAKGDYGIALQELGGHGWSASARGDKKFTTASTYKLFVAYAVLKNIESGTWTWHGQMAGESVEDCFDLMIIQSDNTCAEAFGNTIGWKNIENQMHGLGLTHTTLDPGDFLSTANDELIFMTKLGRGQILSETSRTKLLDVMKRQVYRSGIPAGVDVPVADKVGFLDGILNDAAIVYAPHGTYALVILTDGSSWAGIADAAYKIQNLLQ